MPRYARNQLILAKVETTAGTDITPTNTADAVLVSDLNIVPLDANNIDRALIRSYFGGSEQLVGPATKKVTFSVELAGSGTAGTAPQWGDLLIGCAFAETVTAGNRVEYLPASSSLKTLTIYYYDDGTLHKLLGAMGTVKLSMKVGQRPMLNFEFVGTDGGDTAVSLPTGTFTAWKTPLSMTKASVATDITLGCTYNAGALSGGTAYPSTGLELDIGNNVVFTPLLSSESVDITDRAIVGSMELDLTAAQEVSMMAIVKANTLQQIGMKLGSAAGASIVIHAPTVQLINPTKRDVNGRRLIGFDLRLVPSSGNDELRIVNV